MNNSTSRLAAIAGDILCTACTITQQGWAERPTRYALSIDNDMFAPSELDRDYTGDARMAVTTAAAGFRRTQKFMHQRPEHGGRVDLGFADILAAGLGWAGDKCVCGAVPETLERIRTRPQLRGIDTGRAIRSGELVVFTSPGSLEELRTRMHRELASAPGEHRMLRRLGDMTWASDKMDNAETLKEFECVSNVERLPAVVVCQYGIRPLPGTVIVDGLKSDPSSIIGETIYENPCFMNPDDFIADLHVREPARLAMTWAV